MIQNTIEYGIAQICHSRGVFPPSFFRSLDVGDSGSVTGNGNGNGDRVVMFDLDHLDANADEDAAVDASEDSESSSNGDNLSRDVELSPLTSDFEEGLQSQSAASASAFTNDDDKNHNHGQDHGQNHDRTVKMKMAIMRAEVRLLQHWMGGLHELFLDERQRGLLSRVVFGICTSGSDNDHDNDNDNDNDNDHDHDHDHDHDNGGIGGRNEKDELLESYAVS